VELLGYHPNLNSLSVLDDELLTTKSRCEKEGFIRQLEPVQGESHQGLLDWRLRRSWDVHAYLEFGDCFPVGKVAVRGLFVLIDFSVEFGYRRSEILREFLGLKASAVCSGEKSSPELIPRETGDLTRRNHMRLQQSVSLSRQVDVFNAVSILNGR
jgi:hypothetical protein